MHNGQPLVRDLSGLELEYRILQVYCRDPGRKEAVLGFSLWSDSAQKNAPRRQVAAGNQLAGDIVRHFTIRPASDVHAAAGVPDIPTAPSANPGQQIALQVPFDPAIARLDVAVTNALLVPVRENERRHKLVGLVRFVLSIQGFGW